MNRRAQGIHLESVRNGESEFAEHFSGVARDDGRAEYLARPAVVMRARQAFRLAVENGAVYVIERLCDGGYVETGGLCFGFIKPYVRDFGVGVSDPRHDELAGFGVAEKQGVTQHAARHRFGGVGEFIF